MNLRRLVPNRVRHSWPYQIARHVIRSHDKIYNSAYFADVDTSAMANAAIMARCLVDKFQPNSVIDVGCGTGALLEELRSLGRDVFGLEYSEAALRYCETRKLRVEKFNIERNAPPAGSYDLATSFEVAEHLAPWVSDRFVKLLCELSPMVVVSAAHPGQGGGWEDHVNEQPQSYWIGKFRTAGFKFEPQQSADLAALWRTHGVTSWYWENLMVFARCPGKAGGFR